ncbi:RNA polymerase sigma-70 factor (ECF subfamily) [Nonomuraea polychroma]|uniref:RNA polymerase sigma-70 factor (ECF subfamily) n=1 Tax=Nonomuraea polychroma TaxID=46176 RepID=A0A438ME00_9ACTN|nr:RNA polymerase subunit sigma-70 [Nonomuraea polychroma]RVX43927.1 RNA polymerase sigma-70 factor (ECF subfamily) [Nonomuraea polychroma]
MSTIEDTDAEQARLLAAAQGGDRAAFDALLAPHRRAVHLHCYRMLGSIDQAEDAVQEALLRAWRGLGGYEGRAPLHHWLHKIATMACLRAVERRERLPAVHAEIAHLQPYPDALLDELDPALVVERREEVALAFIAALQLLPPTQRAVVILREVLSWSAAEVAALLDLSVPAVNSSLQRGRAALRAHTARPQRPLVYYEQELLQRFVQSWQRRDLDALAALLREDVILRMPPEQVEIIGRTAVTQFFATRPAGGRLDLIKLVETAANGQPALAAYLPDSTNTCRGYGIMVLSPTPQGVAEIIGFPDPELFRWFDLRQEAGAG